MVNERLSSASLERSPTRCQAKSISRPDDDEKEEEYTADDDRNQAKPLTLKHQEYFPAKSKVRNDRCKMQLATTKAALFDQTNFHPSFSDNRLCFT